MPKDSNNVSKGFAFVEFASPQVFVSIWFAVAWHVAQSALFDIRIPWQNDAVQMQGMEQLLADISKKQAVCCSGCAALKLQTENSCTQRTDACMWHQYSCI